MGEIINNHKAKIYLATHPQSETLFLSRETTHYYDSPNTQWLSKFVSLFFYLLCQFATTHM